MATVHDVRYKQRAVIEFLIAENETVVNIHKRLCAVYGNSAVDRSSAGSWAKRVKASKSEECDLRYLPRSGRPATGTSPGMLNRADDIIRADRRVPTGKLALQLSVCKGSADAFITELGYSEVCARWVPRTLDSRSETTKEDQFVRNCWSVLIMNERLSSPELSHEMKREFIIMNRKRNDSP